MQRRSFSQVRRDLAAIHPKQVAFEIENRKHHRTVEVLVSALAQNAEPLQPAAQLFARMSLGYEIRYHTVYEIPFAVFPCDDGSRRHAEAFQALAPSAAA